MTERQHLPHDQRMVGIGLALLLAVALLALLLYLTLGSAGPLPRQWP